MPGQNTGDFDKIFSSVQKIYQADGLQIKRADGSRPTALQFLTGFGVGYNQITDRYEVGISGGGYVPEVLALTSSAPLTLNGAYSADLSAPIAFAVLVDSTSIVIDGGDNLAVGVITDVQHGARAGASLHALAVPGGAHGFLSGTFATDLTNATAVATTAGTIVKRGASGEVRGAWFESVSAGDPATAGAVRLHSTETIAWRNNAQTGNVTALSKTAADVVMIGETNAASVTIGPIPGSGTPLGGVYSNTSGSFWWYNGADQRLKIHEDANGPVIEFSDDIGANGTIRTSGAQTLVLESNKVVASVAGGEVFTANDQEAILGGNVTIGTQSTGDPDAYQTGLGVLWLPNCASAPTAAPTTGVYIYCEGNVLKKWLAGAGAPAAI